MLSWRVAIVLSVLFSLGIQRPGKHLLIETKESTEDCMEWIVFVEIVIQFCLFQYQMRHQLRPYKAEIKPGDIERTLRRHAGLIMTQENYWRAAGERGIAHTRRLWKHTFVIAVCMASPNVQRIRFTNDADYRTDRPINRDASHLKI